jgi:hypothetical protein
MVAFDRGISVGYDCRWYASWESVVTCAFHPNFCRSHNSRDKHALRSLAIYSQSVCDSTPIAELIERQSRKAPPARGIFVGADSLFPFYGRTQDVAVVSTCTLDVPNMFTFYPRSDGAYSYAGSGTASTHFELTPPPLSQCVVCSWPTQMIAHGKGDRNGRQATDDPTAHSANRARPRDCLRALFVL